MAKLVSTRGGERDRKFVGEQDRIDAESGSRGIDLVGLISSLDKTAWAGEKWPDSDNGGGKPARYEPVCSTQDARRGTPDDGGVGLTDLSHIGVGTVGVGTEPGASEPDLSLRSTVMLASTGRASGGRMATEETFLMLVVALLMFRNPAKLPRSEPDLGLQSTFMSASTGRASGSRKANEEILLVLVVALLVFRNRAS